MTATVQLRIKGMTCSHCVAAVKEALDAVNGVEDVEVTLEPGAARVTGSASVDTLTAAVKEEGYEASVK